MMLYKIVNWDKTEIYYENPETYTVDIKGHKEIIIKNGNESKKNLCIV